MNILALCIGLLIAVCIIFYFNTQKIEFSAKAYPALLFTFPLYYFVFAIYGNDQRALFLEMMIGLLFFFVAALSLRMSTKNKMLLLSAGFIAHGLYDVIHNALFFNAGTPIWWPEFCGIIDIILGVYLVGLFFSCKRILA
ncbi:hypothetical protein [Flocculibacter collagenilyticus]|uniref:hypothetical protein n=1 Tax=Flocculibacter collagenilyticus TaxID=2744479 RepID=UPI0018F44D49|nr:hypothetical protein [Flocculibacter collagenilyticus]